MYLFSQTALGLEIRGIRGVSNISFPMIPDHDCCALPFEDKPFSTILNTNAGVCVLAQHIAYRLLQLLEVSVQTKCDWKFYTNVFFFCEAVRTGIGRPAGFPGPAHRHNELRRTRTHADNGVAVRHRALTRALWSQGRVSHIW